MSQAQHLTLINLPPPSSTPDTPSEMPGTPTSTTTSLSALSTTAIKDGHRGHLHAGATGRGHTHNPSTTSLEAERADRISRLAGLERVSTLRAPPPHQQSSQSPQQTTPTSMAGAGFPPTTGPGAHAGFGNAAPAYFDANGQPTAAAKMSTVGSASASESFVGDGDDGRTQTEDQDEDMLSMDTSYREAADSVASMGPDGDAMDEELDGMATRSVGGFEDRMSDDGSASLVGFGEGAGSTVSGPIYHRRPLPGMVAPGGSAAGAIWGLERRGSGLSDGMTGSVSGPRRDRDIPMGSETPVTAAALQERREARMVDGVAADAAGVPDEEIFVDTTTRGPVPVSQLPLPQQQLLFHQQQGAQGYQQPPPVASTSREAAERILRERLDGGEAGLGGGASTLGSPGKGGERLGKFYFEEKK